MSTLPKFYWVQQTHTWVIVFWQAAQHRSQQIRRDIGTNKNKCQSHKPGATQKATPGSAASSQPCLQPCAPWAGSVFLLVCSHQCESSLPQGMVLCFMGIHYRHMVNFSSVHNYKRTFWGQHKKTSRTVDDKISWQHSGIIWPFQKTAIGLFHFVIDSNDNTKF